MSSVLITPPAPGYTGTSTVTASSVVAPGSMFLTVAPTSSSAAIFIAGYGVITYAGTVNFSTPGHASGLFGSFRNSVGKTIGLGIGVEGTIENNHASGILTLACGGVSALNANLGTITEFAGHVAQVTSNAGTITKGHAYSARMTSNAGTITEWNHFQAPASTLTGVTKMRFWKNEDSQINSYSAGPICDASFGISAPTAAGTTILNSTNANGGFPVSTYVLNPAALIASQTLTFPTSAMGNGLDDGQEVKIFTTQTITSLTYTAGPIMYGAPSTLAINAFFTMKYFSSLAGWLRIA